MSIPSNIPQISALKRAVENILGEPLQTHNAFISLVGEIESAVNDHMSESTLERLWGYSTRRCDVVSVRTLNVLARFTGAASWDDFCRTYRENAERESEELELRGDFLDVTTLAADTVIRLGWLPDRIIEARYLGEHRFEITASQNSSLQPGDRFSCLQIQKGRQLFLDKFTRSGSESETCYVVGQDHGITTLQII